MGGRRQQVTTEELQTLQRDYTDATDQFAAMNEVLIALGKSASDPDAVLDSIVESVPPPLPLRGRRHHADRGGPLRPCYFGRLLERVRELRPRPSVQTRPRLADREAARSRYPADAGRAHRSGVRTPGRSEDRPLPEPSWRLRCCWTTKSSAQCPWSAPRSIPLDDRSLALVGAFAAGRDRRPRRPPGAQSWRAWSGAGRESGTARGARARSAGSSAESGPGRGAVRRGRQRRALLALRRRLDHQDLVEEEQCFSVRSAYAADAELLGEAASGSGSTAPTLVGRSAFRESDCGRRPQQRRTRSAPRTVQQPDAGVGSGGAGASRRADHRRPRRPTQVARRLLPRHHRVPGDFTSRSALAMSKCQFFRRTRTRPPSSRSPAAPMQFLASMSGTSCRTPLNAGHRLLRGACSSRSFGETQRSSQDEYLRDIWNSARRKGCCSC